MNFKTDIERRKFLQRTGATALTAAIAPNILLAAELRIGRKPSPNFNPDVEIELISRPMSIAILPGRKTRVWKTQGKVVKGSKDSVVNLQGSYLGPTLRFHKGQKIRINFRNKLAAQTIMHWHGMHVPAEMDGNPMYAIHAGESFIYEFEIRNPAGTNWYHAHTHHLTAKQVYSGLAGLFIVTDDEEQSLGLPSGEFDVPLVIQDRSFDKSNQLLYPDNMMTRMHGFLGDRILINGSPDFILPVASQAYRLRLLNGSNSRIYKLAWDDNTPMTVIGTEGSLLERPEKRNYLTLAPGERRELWMDFSDRKVGSELTLRSLEFEGSHGGMMGGGMMGGRMGGGMMGGGMMSSSALPNGGKFPVMKVRIERKGNEGSTLPNRLTSIPRYKLEDAVNAENPRVVKLSMRRMAGLLNGRSYKMNDVQPDERIPVNTLQLIQFDNGYQGMGGMMSMPHPMHLHGQQFQVIKREINSRSKHAFETLSDGFVDNGWKDIALVMPGERVTLLKRFDDFKGMFMYHCHNLEHEDLGMMRDFLVE
ncbi:MAG: multicopper oxidase domain-containing protein [Methylococcales bacterium]